MIKPQRAPVRPRVVSSETGDTLPLDEVVSARLESGPGGCIEIVGGPATGKSTALAHLASLPFAWRLALVDEGTWFEVKRELGERLVVYTSTFSYKLTTTQYRLAPWDNDELIEYLLTKYPDRCASVMSRVGADLLLAGSPLLYSVVAEELARDESIKDVAAALRSALAAIAGAEDFLHDVQRLSAAALLGSGSSELLEVLQDRGASEQLLRLLQFRPVKVWAAADWIVQQIRGRVAGDVLHRRLPPELLQELIDIAKVDATLLEEVRELLRSDSLPAPVCASILHGADPAWRPRRRLCRSLKCAALRGADWAGLDLRGIDLSEADLRRSNLRKCRLKKAQLTRVNFAGADLSEADLRSVEGPGADFSGANLRQAILTRVRLWRANFRGANLEEVWAGGKFSSAIFDDACARGANFADCDLAWASFAGADFSGADLARAILNRTNIGSARLTGARLDGANLANCVLEGLNLPEARLEGANLQKALLTDSFMPRANLRRAQLQGTGLADINWEGADLRGADLRGASFHLGTTRSGLVGSPYTSHGTRTGFYTNEFDEQTYRAPEEIRKANLRGADLRGARIEGVDFYLVDLRGAKYDAGQAAYFERCQAILVTPQV